VSRDGLIAPAVQTLWLLRRSSLRVKAALVEGGEAELTIFYGGIAASRQSFTSVLDAVRVGEALHERLRALGFRRERPDARLAIDAGDRKLRRAPY